VRRFVVDARVDEVRVVGRGATEHPAPANRLPLQAPAVARQPARWSWEDRMAPICPEALATERRDNAIKVDDIERTYLSGGSLADARFSSPDG
jgi:hypothetical protein